MPQPGCYRFTAVAFSLRSMSLPLHRAFDQSPSSVDVGGNLPDSAGAPLSVVLCLPARVAYLLRSFLGLGEVCLRWPASLQSRNEGLSGLTTRLMLLWLLFRQTTFTRHLFRRLSLAIPRELAASDSVVHSRCMPVAAAKHGVRAMRCDFPCEPTASCRRTCRAF